MSVQGQARSIFPGAPAAPRPSAPSTARGDIDAFLNSNSIVAKVAFLIMVVFIFMILLKLGSTIMSYAFSPSETPYLVKGTKSAKEMLRIPQDPAQKGSIPIIRSRNQAQGLEFTWSVWIFVESLTDYLPGKYKNVFYKGASAPGSGGNGLGKNFPNNGPGLYIKPDTNSLAVIMNTYSVINEEITIPDLPMNKWVNVIIRVEGNVLDVYINGVIAVRHVLSDVPKQNYGDVWVNANGGYDGLLSSLRYFNYGLSTMEIYSIAQGGPDLTMDKSLDIAPPYLSLRWYFDQN